MKKICFIINKPLIGGAELFLLKLTEDVSLYAECHIIFLNPNGPLHEKFQAGRRIVHAVNFTLNPFLIVKEFFKLRALLARIRPDIVHTWLYMSDFVGGIAAVTVGKNKLYWSIRQSNVSYSQNKLHTFLLIRICGMFSRILPLHVIACSEVAMAAHVKKCFYAGKKITVIPNGVITKELRYDYEKRTLFRNELGLGADKTKIVAFIGRYDIQKGVDNFIEIAALIKDKIGDCLFLLIGPECTSNNKELFDLLVKSNIQSCIKLMGPRNDIKDLLSGIDLLVIASRGEAFPNVLVEAMSTEVPVVTTNVGEIPIILEGIQDCYQPGDNEGMAKRGIQLLLAENDSRNEYKQQLRNRIMERYEFEAIMKMYREKYEGNA